MNTPVGVDPLFLSFQLALAGRYSIDRELGRGGMGVVYLAREVHLDRMVAIKLLPPDKASDPSLRDRFLREARLAAKLSHPNIIPIHAVDETREFVFYVMAFIDGETLAQRVRARGPLTSSDGARVLREVAWALSHAHSHGLVHRDVKPDNILLEFSTDRVLVADFGIAAATHEIAGAGVSGTPEFMSPEQALGGELDARSDLYALGVTAFYALTGRLPFEGKSATEILAKQVTEAAPPLLTMGLPVARKIAVLVDRCLAKEPDHRPASADALAEQLGVAIDQRKELPVALRAFVKRSARLDGGGTLVFPGVLLIASVGVAMAYGGTAGYAAFAAGVAAAPLAYFVHVARNLTRMGFGYRDIGPAFAVEAERARDEHAVDHVRGGPSMDRVLLNIARVSGAAFGASCAAVIMGVKIPGLLAPLIYLPQPFTPVPVVHGVPSPMYVMALTPFIVLGVLSVGSLIAYLTSVQRRRDIDTDFWTEVWTGPIGRSAFAIARKLVGKGARVSAVTHRATELSLGMAAESLFDTLPQEARRALGDLPDVVRRLQDDAQALRKLYNELHEAVQDAGDASPSSAYAALRADRDRVHGKLGTAVGALETIRLNLLRLHAGSGSIEGLTTHIDLAAEVSAEVERMLAARSEVEQTLAFPREIVATPV